MCGGTRMVLSALSGRLDQAFWFNPLLFMTFVVALGWFVTRYLTGYRLSFQATRTGWYIVAGLAIVLIMANWVYLVAALDDLKRSPGAAQSQEQSR